MMGVMKQRVSSFVLVLGVAGAGLAACKGHAPPPADKSPTDKAPTGSAAGSGSGSAGSAAAAGAPAETGVFVADLDRSIDPCTDFFEFSNGTWRKQNPIPPEQQRWSRRWKSGEDAKDQLKNILDEVSAKTDWPAHSVEQLIGDFYGGCMDQTKIDQRGVEPIKPLLTEIEKLKAPAEVGQMFSKLELLQIGAPFGYGSNPDLHTPTEVIGWVIASGLGLPDRDYYTKTEPRFVDTRAKYLDHVAKMFVLIGHPEATAKAEAATVMKVETGLAKASLDNVALRDPTATDHPGTVADLQKMTPSLDWAAYYKATGVAPNRLNITQPKFFAEVEHQLKTTPVADWRTYLTWQVVSSAAASLSQPFVDEDFAFNGKFLNGTTENKPRWKRCVEATDSLLGEALGKKYTDKYFPPAAKARMQELVKNLFAALHDSIDQLEWMSAETKKRAQQKLSTFNPKIGYPDKWKDYSSIPVRRDQYWESLVAARQWNVADDLAQINKPVDRGRWGMTPPTSNAYYNPSLNEIVFPAGILQPPAFSLDNADAINYGAIGVVIGHEISHGFDDQGAQFDDQGRLNNWWTKDDLEKFHQRGQCVVDQFDHFFIEPGIHHNGKLVLGESIGDLGGANIAYRAFQKAKQQHPAPTIDGFTPEQQFFIAWGQFRGDAIRPETQRLMVQGDPHPIGKYRVIGPLSNVPAFAQAFACKPDAAMVRPEKDRCSIW
jgi:putative endopeptidase